MERYTHVHCVCGGSEPEYTSDRKDFILGPRLGGGGGGGGQQVFGSLQGRTEIFYSGLWGTVVFVAHVSHFRSPPGGNK